MNFPSISKHRRSTLPIVAFLAVVLAGCGASQAASAPDRASSTAPSIQAIVASSDLAVGKNRFTFGLLANNHPIETAGAAVVFFTLKGNVATARERVRARFNYFARGLRDTDANQAAIDIGGVYVAYPTFSHPGTWGMAVSFPYRGHRRTVMQRFTVRSRGLTPAVGTAAPRSRNPTTAQLPASKLDSGTPPDDMHALSIAAAIAQKKPLVVLFATAAFCTSRLCGPEIQVVQGLERGFRHRVNFVHIEIYKDARFSHGFAPTVKQWRLVTEPWVFVVNRRGIITAKFEGPAPASEIQPALTAALRS